MRLIHPRPANYTAAFFGLLLFAIEPAYAAPSPPSSLVCRADQVAAEVQKVLGNAQFTARFVSLHRFPESVTQFVTRLSSLDNAEPLAWLRTHLPALDADLTELAERRSARQSEISYRNKLLWVKKLYNDAQSLSAPCEEIKKIIALPEKLANLVPEPPSEIEPTLFNSPAVVGTSDNPVQSMRDPEEESRISVETQVPEIGTEDAGVEVNPLRVYRSPVTPDGDREETYSNQIIKLVQNHYSNQFAQVTAQIPDYSEDMRYRTINIGSDGRFRIFASLGEGPLSKTTGARILYFFPRRVKPAVLEEGLTQFVRVRLASGDLITFSLADGLIRDFSGGEFQEIDPRKVVAKDRGGLEVKLTRGLVLDSGWSVGNDPVYRARALADPGKCKGACSAFVDRAGRRCVVPNREIYNINSQDYTIKFDTDAELVTYLRAKVKSSPQTCEELDLTELENSGQFSTNEAADAREPGEEVRRGN